jgi:hypothetical protein
MRFYSIAVNYEGEEIKICPANATCDTNYLSIGTDLWISIDPLQVDTFIDKLQTAIDVFKQQGLDKCK